MDIEVLHIGECPGWELAAERTREALDIAGRADVRVSTRALGSDAEAAAAVFAGSPTIVVDGADLFPSDGRTASLACRVYRTDQGLAPAPTTAQIVEAIRQRIGA
jgi:hypothetical protein